MIDTFSDRYFHGCGECRECCNGKFFSNSMVKYSDIRRVANLFPMVFDTSCNELKFLYTLVPTTPCFYLRDNNCSIYNLFPRPDACIIYPFGVTEEGVISCNSEGRTACKNITYEKSDFPLVIDNQPNPKIFEEFFSEQILSMNVENNPLSKFIKLVFENEAFKPMYAFKVADRDMVMDPNLVESNKRYRVLDRDKIQSIVDSIEDKKLRNEYNDFIALILSSLDHLELFGKRTMDLYESKQKLKD